MIKTFTIAISGEELAYSGSMSPQEALLAIGQILIDYGAKTTSNEEARVDDENGD